MSLWYITMWVFLICFFIFVIKFLLCFPGCGKTSWILSEVSLVSALLFSLWLSLRSCCVRNGWSFRIFENKISRQILETEIRNHHVKKSKLTWQLKENTKHINNKISLDQNIPTENNTNNIRTEFESFYYHIQKHTKNLDQELQKKKLKIKTRRICANLFEIKSTL